MPVKYPDPQTIQMPQVDPLRLLALRQQMEESELQRETLMRQRQKQDAETFMKAIEIGVDPEVAHQGLQFLDTGSYNVGLEYAKKLKQNQAAASAEASLPAVAQALTPIQTPQGGVAAAPRSEAAGQTWIDAVNAGRPDIAQRINLLADATANAAQTEVGQRAAQEAKEKRSAAYSAGLTRSNMAYGEQLQAEGERRRQSLELETDMIRRARDAAASGQKLTNDAVATIMASNDPQARRQLYDALATQGYGPSAIKRIVDSSRVQAIAQRQELLAKRTTQGQGSAEERVIQAKGLVRNNPNDQEALDVLEVNKQAVRLPWTIPGAPLAANYLIGPIQANEQRLKGAYQMVGLEDKLHSLNSQILLASRDPEAIKQLSGLAGTDSFQYFRRITSSQNPIVAAIGTKLTMLQKDVAGVGNVGQITDFEQMMAKLALPLMTEMFTADGRVSPAAQARISELLSLSDMNKKSLIDPTVKAQLEERVQMEMAAMTPAQRRLVSEYQAAVNTGDEKTVAGAIDRATKAGLRLGSGRGPGVDEAERKAAEMERRLGLGGP